MSPTEALDRAIQITRARMAEAPGFALFQSIELQLKYLQGVVAGTNTDRTRLHSLTFGHFASREFEESDPELARALHAAFYVASKMAKGLKVGDVPE